MHNLPGRVAPIPKCPSLEGRSIGDTLHGEIVLHSILCYSYCLSFSHPVDSLARSSQSPYHKYWCWSQASPSSHFLGLNNPNCTKFLHQAAAPALSTLVTLLGLLWLVRILWIRGPKLQYSLWFECWVKGDNLLPHFLGLLSLPGSYSPGWGWSLLQPELTVDIGHRAAPESLSAQPAPLQKASPSCGQGICPCWVPSGSCQLINPPCLKPPGHNSALDCINWSHQFGITWQLAGSRLHLLLRGISTGIKQDKSQEGSWVTHWPPGWVWSINHPSLSPATQAPFCAHPIVHIQILSHLNLSRAGSQSPFEEFDSTQ